MKPSPRPVKKGKVTMYQVKKGFVTKVVRDFQSTFHVVFRNQGQAKNLIEYAVAKFILESNKPTWIDAKGRRTSVIKITPPK